MATSEERWEERWTILGIVTARYHGERSDRLSAQLEDPLEAALSLLDLVFEEDQGSRLTMLLMRAAKTEPV